MTLPSTVQKRTGDYLAARVGRLALLLAAAATAALPAGCQKPSSAADPSGRQGRGDKVVPVRAGLVSQATVPIQVKNIGQVEAYETVSIKSMVAGVLTEVHFKEGQALKKGDLLFKIDSRSFEAAVRQAEANLERDKANSVSAELQLQRTSELYKLHSATQNEHDLAVAVAAALKASCAADQAAIENARVQVDYCTIRCPIDGVAGAVLIDQGNVVKANDVAMVVVNQLVPVYVSFSVPEQNLPAIRKALAAGPVQVQSSAPADCCPPAEGTLTFINNAVNTLAGTIQLKATFPNADQRLWPGQFVDVTMTLSRQKDALVLPSRAIQTSQNGQFVFVIKDDMTVEDRPIAVDREVDGQTVVKDGVRPGERVVTDGQLLLVKGAKVQILPDAAAAPASQPTTTAK